MGKNADGACGQGTRNCGRVTIAARAIGAIADILIPPMCLACHEPLGVHHALCARCWCEIDFIRPPLCDRLGIPMPFDTGGTLISPEAAANPPRYDRARAVARFEGPMRNLVHDFKFRDQQNAQSLFGRWLAEAGRDVIPEANLVVPVPLNRLRLFTRRYNQAALLAEELAQLCGLAFEPLMLARTRRTIPQIGLSRRQRQKNVRGAFAVPARKQKLVAGRNILLVDDVITTGSTVDAAARCLKKAGAARVDVLALALAVGTN